MGYKKESNKLTNKKLTQTAVWWLPDGKAVGGGLKRVKGANIWGQKKT